jgi:hypothetical protein
LQSFRATYVKACGPEALFKGRNTETQSRKNAWRKALVGAFHHACLRGKTTEDIAVKLVKRKTYDHFEASL